MLTPFTDDTTEAKANEPARPHQMGARQDWLLLLGLSALGLIVGWLFGAIAISLLGALVIWVAIEFRQYRRVARWSQRPWRRPKNGFDSWFNLAYQPYRALLRERSRTRKATSRLRQILNLVELIPDGVLVLNESGELEGMNNAASGLLQLDDADVGLVLATILRDPEFVTFVNNKEYTEDLQILEFVSPINADHTLEARKFRIVDGGQILLVRDITTLNRLLTVRQNFVANVSHELRTPLAIIQGYMESITAEEEETELRLALTQRLVSPLARMQSLVDDLLLLTRLESTDVRDDLSRVKLSTIAKNVVDDLAGMHETRLDFQGDEDTFIAGNTSELHSLCANLISNALRYSADDAAVEISVRRHAEVVELSVRDFGVGIAPEHIERLTERFYRVDMADARTRGGTGLGLAIVKHVLRRHDSILTINSELGVGSTFSCAFALYPDDDSEPSTPNNNLSNLNNKEPV